MNKTFSFLSQPPNHQVLFCFARICTFFIFKIYYLIHFNWCFNRDVYCLFFMSFIIFTDVLQIVPVSLDEIPFVGVKSNLWK